MCYHRSGSNYSPITNCDTTYDCYIGTNPAAITYHDRLSKSTPTVFSRSRIPRRYESFRQLRGMRSRIYLHARGDEHIIANYNRIAIIKYAPIIDADIVAHMDIVTKSNDDSVTDRDIRPYTSKQFAYHTISLGEVCIWKRAITLHPLSCTSLAIEKYRIMAIVYFASHAFVLFCHYIR